MMKQERGFTLIELIIVIVILGILAAYAVPKYMSIDKEARVSVVKGLGGTMRSAAEMVHAVALVKGASGNVDIGSATVNIGNSSYPDPDAAGIVAALADTDGFTTTVDATNDAIVFTKDGATDTDNCSVTYTSDGANNPTYDTVTSGC